MRYHTRSRGFTLVELLIVIVVLGILSSIAFFSMNIIQRDARDGERKTKMTIVVEALEKYYEANGQYPTVADMTYDNANGNLTQLLKLKDEQALRMPGASDSTHNSFGANTPTSDKPVYAGTPNNADCTTAYSPPYGSGLCTGYTITWVSESGETTELHSRRS